MTPELFDSIAALFIQCSEGMGDVERFVNCVEGLVELEEPELSDAWRRWGLPA